METNLADKLTNVIHVTVKEEIVKVRADFDSEICAIKTKLLDMLDMEKTLQGSDSAIAVGASEQKPCSMIIRNLKESRDEPEG